MAGDISNPRLWEGADLYTAPLGTEFPGLDADLSEDEDWTPVGLLSEDGATESRDEDVTDHYAWGNILVRTSRAHHKRQMVVTALEDNLAVFGLVNPGSTAETAAGVNTRTVMAPTSDRRAFMLELRDGTITRRRYIHTGMVESVGEISLSESELQAFELTITIYPDAAGVLYMDYDNDANNAAPAVPSP